MLVQIAMVSNSRRPDYVPGTFGDAYLAAAESDDEDGGSAGIQALFAQAGRKVEASDGE